MWPHADTKDYVLRTLTLSLIEVIKIMSINIQARGFRLTAALRDYVSTKLEKTRLRYRDQIPKVSVTLQDINGPRGGEDMRCKIIFTVDGQRPLVIQETAEDMYDAIAIAASRANSAVTRQFERIQDRKRKAVNIYHISDFGAAPDLDIDALDEIENFHAYHVADADYRYVS
jgi:ribosomal subunit interface protein